jgi:hypothetical protein
MGGVVNEPGTIFGNQILGFGIFLSAPKRKAAQSVVRVAATMKSNVKNNALNTKQPASVTNTTDEGILFNPYIANAASPARWGSTIINIKFATALKRLSSTKTSMTCPPELVPIQSGICGLI